MKRLKPTIIGWLLALAPSLAPAEEPLTWVVSELTGFIKLDETAADGPRLTDFVGRMQAALLSELPEFNVTLTSMSVPRMYRELQRKDNLCTGMLLRTPERETFVRFSRPYVILPTPQIVLTETAWQRLDRPVSLKLEDLLSHPDLTGLRVESRSYGAFIDRHLSDTDNGNMEGMATGFDNAVRMLGANRADYIIEYPPVVTQVLGSRADELAFVTIEGTPPFLEVSVGCSRTEFGRRVIDRVNAVLTKLVNDPRYRALNVDSQPRPVRDGLVEYYRAAIEGRRR